MDLPAQLLLLLLAAVSGSFAFPAQDGIGRLRGTRVRRVAGGEEVEVTFVPYQARIEMPIGNCGGTIIHPSYVLTAKHCVMDRNGLKETWVKVGAPSGQGLPEVRRQVRRAATFPGKKQAVERRRWLPHDLLPDAVMGDIALLQVDPPFPTDRVTEIRPVALQRTRGYVAENCVLSGWGVTNTSDDSPARLRAANVEVFSRDMCLNLEKRLKDDYICAGRRGGGVDACYGDSGGPLVCQGLLTGVVRGGRGCGESMQVSKYTEVALYARWVAHEVGIEEERLGFAWEDA